MLKILLLLISLNQGLSSRPNKLNLAQAAASFSQLSGGAHNASSVEFTGYPECKEGMDTRLCTAFVPSVCKKGKERAKFLRFHNLLKERMLNIDMMAFAIDPVVDEPSKWWATWQMVIPEQEYFSVIPAVGTASAIGILSNDYDQSRSSQVTHFTSLDTDQKQFLKEKILAAFLAQRIVLHRPPYSLAETTIAKINIKHILDHHDDFFSMLFSNKTEDLLAKAEVKMACFRKPKDEKIIGKMIFDSKFFSPDYPNQSAIYNFHSVTITPEAATWFAGRQMGRVGNLFMESFLLKDGEELVVIHGYVLK